MGFQTFNRRWGTRRWNRNWTRVAPAFTPASVTGMMGWWAADSTLFQNAARTIPVTTDGDPVGSVTDLSAAANNLSQGTSTKRPLWRTNVLGGKPVFRFDGVDDFLQKIYALNQPLTVFLVGKWVGTANEYMHDGTAINTASVSNAASTVKVRLYAGTVLDVVTDPTVFAVLASVFNGVSGALVRNGTKTPGPVGANIPGGTTLGISGDTTGQPLNGDIAEAIVYNVAVSDANIALIGGYLASKYGLVWT